MCGAKGAERCADGCLPSRSDFGGSILAIAFHQHCVFLTAKIARKLKPTSQEFLKPNFLKCSSQKQKKPSALKARR